MADTTQHKTSLKQTLIDKANVRIVVVMAVAAFVTVFCVIASKYLLSQSGYQSRVISAQKQALNGIKADLNATSNLVSSYQAFVNQPQNILGGNPDGNANSKDGNNAKIILDALPSSYDFPAMVTSLEKMLTSQPVVIQGISGTDQVSQQGNNSSANPSPIAMPFQINVLGNYQSIQGVVSQFENSIRPIQVQTMELNGDDQSLTLTMSAQTFYQPQKNLTITTETIK